jgi:glycosyltransferase involved in cell wall biosynthesis
MKIAFVIQTFDQLIPPHQNSIGLWTFHIAPQVAKTNEVLVYGKRHAYQRAWNGQKNVGYHFMRPILPNRIMLERIGTPIEKVGGHKLPFYASRLYFLDYITQVAWDLRQQKVDVAHVHNFTQFVPVIRAIAPNVKIALHMNCEWLNQLDYEVMKERIEQSDLVLGSSDYIAGKVRARYPEYSDRCDTLYNGVDVDLFHGENGRGKQVGSGSRLLFVGRVSPEKGVHILIEAFAQIADQFPDAELNLAGPVISLPYEYIVGISEEPEVAALARFYEEDYGITLQRMVEENNLTGRVHFLGSMAQTDLVKHYQSADILVNPSYSESFGMSLVEAMASETPVIATRVGGMVNIVDDNETGLLVERDDVEALVGALQCLLENGALRQQMGTIGRQRVIERFSWPQVARSALEKYAAVL